jgi:PST family polysaccharide transporter
VGPGTPNRATDARTNAEIQETTASALPWIALTRIGVEILLLASMVVLARLIPPSAFGVFALAIIVQELAIVVPGEGVGGPLVQRREVTRAHFQAGFAVSLAIGLVLGALTLVIAATVVRAIFGDQTASIVALTTPWFLLGAILAMPTALLRRRLDFRHMAMLDVAQTVVRAATSIVLAAVFGLDAEALVFGGVAGMFVTTLLACIFAPVPLPRWRRKEAKDLLPYGLPAAMTSVVWTGFRNGDYAIIAARLGTVPAGLYWRGYQLGVEYQRKVSVVLNQVAFPMFARTIDVDEMFALRQRMVWLATVAIFPPLVLLMVLAPVIVPWLFGSEWTDAVLPTQILAAGGAAMVVNDIAGSVLLARGRARAVLIWAIAHFIVYAGAVIFASRYGLAAVCFAAVSSHTVFLVLYYWMLVQDRPERALPLLWRDIRAAAVSSVALAAVAWSVNAFLGEEGVPTIPRIILVSCAGTAAYLISLRIWFPSALRDLLRLVRRVVPTERLRATIRRVPLLANR